MARRAAHSLFSDAVFARAAEVYNFLLASGQMPIKDYLTLRASCHDRCAPDGTLLEVRIPSLPYPVFVRRGTSDGAELIHTVLRHSYAAHLPDGDIRFIVDAGANIGDSTVWYLNRFPKAKVVAIEPHPETFKLLKRNCAPYGDRVVLMNAGLWWREQSLKIASGISFSEISLAEAGGSSDCPGVTIPQILDEQGVQTLDIFKCDIEGAETELFSNQPESWLGRTRSVYVDVHNAKAKEAVCQAAGRNGFMVFRHRELMVLQRK